MRFVLSFLQGSVLEYALCTRHNSPLSTKKAPKKTPPLCFFPPGKINHEALVLMNLRGHQGQRRDDACGFWDVQGAGRGHQRLNFRRF